MLQTLLYPNNALTCTKCMVIKNTLNISKLILTCFGSLRKHPQGENVSA